MTLMDVLDQRAPGPGPTPLWTFPGEGEEIPLAEIMLRSRACARRLERLGVRAGDRVGLLLENGSPFVCILLGLWRLNAVAVPLRPTGGSHPGPDSPLGRILAHGGFSLVLFDAAAGNGMAREWAAGRGAQGLDLPAFLACPEGRDGAARPGAGDTAVIQYSSGSTGHPKGVVVTHGMVLSQVRQIDQTYRSACDGSGVRASASWLPFNHDMGLFIGILHPLFRGCANLLASPRYYMYKPKRWFGHMAEKRTNLHFTTNLAMANSLRSLAQLEPGSLDLSGLFLYFGAEKVAPVVLEKSRAVLAGFGMRENQVLIGYGMAENTLGAASTGRGRINRLCVRVDGRNRVSRADPAAEGAVEVLAVGEPHAGTSITIRDGAGLGQAEWTLGEICIAGPCVTPGYFRDPEATRRVLGEGFLRTGDLGFFADGELYFHARMDDMLVVGGRNIAPDDVENCAEEMDFIAPGGTALIEVADAESGKNGMLLLVEHGPGAGAGDLAERGRLVQSEVYRKSGVLVPKIAFCGRNVIEKTTSGKKRRGAIRERFLAGKIEVLHGASGGEAGRVR